MSIPLLLWLLSTKILLLLDMIQCAPKIGGILFEPILFEAFDSDEKTTTPTEKDKAISESTANTTMIFVMTESSNKSVVQENALRSEVEMEYPEEESITSTTSSTTTPKKTTAFITELNIETVSTTLNTTSPFNYSSAEPNNTSTITQTTKKVMLYEVLTPDKLKRYGRARDETTTYNAIINFLGYNFDDTICRMVDDRVLCGYNSNSQLVQPVQTVEVGKGCRLRGDRIECGYVNPPFDGIRRPPASRPKDKNRRSSFLEDQVSDRRTIKTTRESLKLSGSVSTQKPTTTTTSSTYTITNIKVISTGNTTPKAVSASLNTTELSHNTTTVSTTERQTIQKQEHCVEKGDRIVCYDIKDYLN